MLMDGASCASVRARDSRMNETRSGFVPTVGVANLALLSVCRLLALIKRYVFLGSL